jgi:hypothetical protein
MKTFINVAQMKLATLQAGQFVETGGETVKGDIGAARYLVVDGTVVGSKNETLASGNTAVFQYSGATNNLDIINLQEGQTAGVIVFATYALLDAYTPVTAQEKASFKVTDDSNTSLNGYYSWVSGTIYTKDADLVENVIDPNNTSDGVSGSAVATFTERLNVRSTLINLDYLLPFANNADGIVEYNSQLAIKADIQANTFQLYTPSIPIANLGLVDGEDVFFGCKLHGRSGTIFIETRTAANALITQTNSTGAGFVSQSNTITSNTAFVRFIIIINTSAGVDYVYIATPIVSKTEPNENTIDTYNDSAVKDTEVQSNISTLQSDMSTAQSDITTAQSDITTARADITSIEAGFVTGVNIVTSGAMDNLSQWSAGTLDSNGLNVTGTGTLVFSNDSFPISIDTTLSTILHIFNNSATSKTIQISFFNGAYVYPARNVVLEAGENEISFDLVQNASFVAGNYRLFINTNNTVDISIASIVAVPTSQMSLSLLLKMYEESGFQLSYSASKYAENAASKLEKTVFEAYQTEVNAKLDPVVYTLYAYATTASHSNDPANGIYAGEIAYVNAIARAVASVPVDTNDIYQIRCVGEFLATTFDQMSVIDGRTGTYRCMVDLSKDNIELIGAGEKATVIFADLPSTGAPLNYSFYQTVTLENKSCKLVNMVIKGRNLRYPVHTEANSTGPNLAGAVLNFKDVHFWHLGNSDTALAQWTSFFSYGIGFGRRFEFNAINCRFTSVGDSGLGGHDGYGVEKVDVNLKGCTFDSTAYNIPNKAIDFRMFGNNDSAFNFNLIGNNFNNGVIALGNRSQTGLGAYATLSGHSNSKTRFSQSNDHGYYPEMSDVKHNPKNLSGGPIAQYDALDYKYELATGEIHSIAFESSNNGDKFIAIKNCILLLSLFTIKTGETITDGDYVSADNGELVYSATKTTARCLTMGGVLQLSID